MEKQGIISKRIRNQLRIHWKWLRNESDYNAVANFIDSWIRQALSSKPSDNNDFIQDCYNPPCGFYEEEDFTVKCNREDCEFRKSSPKIKS